ncbi:hypothetical protein XELAEV_18041222mg [Xenopus laevis]|uniref:Uncharacterized protein n=1 Tax=Xenopus laevis TaxID=8355 RepID=A0A974H5C1_XENLA|nr:hypothetical protein XELAEV_18041222mg [Xenopus laevis]
MIMISMWEAWAGALQSCCNSTWQSTGRKSNSSSSSAEAHEQEERHQHAFGEVVSIALECGCGGSGKQTRRLEIWNNINKVTAVHTTNAKNASYNFSIVISIKEPPKKEENKK